MTNAQSCFVAFAEPLRVAIFEHLAKQPMAVSQLAAQLPISRPAVSQHLKVLKEARLVTDRPDGTRRVYSVDLKGLTPIRQWLDRHWDAALAEYIRAAEGGTE